MRKLIRVSAVAFLVWAITTLAWAAIHHVTGVTGPAEASGASLDFVASAVTFVDPPGVLGAPQRFAAGQIRQAADAVERIHRGPERFAARLVDELGHRHRHGRRGGRRHVHEVRINRHIGEATAEAIERALGQNGFAIPLDEFDQQRAHAEARAVIELNRHRQRLDEARGRLDQERGRLELRRELEGRQRERIQRSMERVRERLERASAEQDGDFRRKLEEKLREILRELDKELNEAHVIQLDQEDGNFTFDFKFDGTDIELHEIGEAPDAPVRIRIRNR